MDIDRMRQLAGMDPILTESEMSPEEQLVALEKQRKDEVDPRARSILDWKIKKLRETIGK